MFDLFKCQLPIELHENALYALLNLLSSASKQVKEFLIMSQAKKPPTSGGVSHLLKFAVDLYEVEYNLLRGGSDSKFIIVDYGVKQNPLFEPAQYKDEKTIEEMQPLVFDIKYYEYENGTNEMYYYPEVVKGAEPRQVVKGDQF